MNRINENWEVSGIDEKAFYDALEAQDNCTKHYVLSLEKVALVSILTPIEVSKYTSATIRSGVWPVKIVSRRGGVMAATQALAQKVIFPDITGKDFDAVVRQAEDVGMLLTFSTDQGPVTLPLSSNAFIDLADRCKINCEAIRHNCLERAAWMATQIRDSQICLVIRTEGRSSKIMAVRGQVYTGIKQSPCIKRVQTELEADLGSAKVKSWEISNNLTRVNFEFPEHTKDIISSLRASFIGKEKEIDALEELCNDGKLVPVVSVCNSDTGLSSFKVYSGFSIDGTCCIRDKSCVKQDHNKRFELSKIMERVKKAAFKEFLSWPSEFVRLIGIDISPTAMPDCVEELLNFIKLDKDPGMKKIRATIKEQMLNEFSMGSFTAYDLVKYILTAPSCLTVFNKTKNAEKELPDSTMNRLILACSEAVYCPFKTAEDDDDDFVILPT